MQTELIDIPNNAESIKFKVNIFSYQPDTLSNGSLNNNIQTPFRLINFSLLAKDNSSSTLINNIGNQFLNNSFGLHNLSKEFTLNANALRERNIYLIPNISFSGSFIPTNLRFSLVNVSIEGEQIPKDSTEITENNTIPSEFQLEQNYPNPFNPVTQIRFSIVEDGLVTLRVFDVLGKEVAVLTHENKLAGTYSISFDASNLASGIYFYSISAGKFSQTKKMILAK